MPIITLSPPLLSISERTILSARIATLEVASGIDAAGRPLKLLQPSVCDESITTGEYLCARARQGSKLTTSSAAVGVIPGTVKSWLRKGQAIAQTIESGEHYLLNNNDKHYYAFHLDYRAAEAEYYSSLENEDSRVALEGVVTTRTHDEFITNPVTGEVIETRTIVDNETTIRDGKRAAELLATYDPAFAPPSRQLKLTGSVDTTLTVESPHSFSNLIKLARPDEALVIFDLLQLLMKRADNVIETTVKE